MTRSKYEPHQGEREKARRRRQRRRRLRLLGAGAWEAVPAGYTVITPDGISVGRAEP